MTSRARTEKRIREALRNWQAVQDGRLEGDPATISEETVREIDAILYQETGQTVELRCEICGGHPLCGAGCPEGEYAGDPAAEGAAAARADARRAAQPETFASQMLGRRVTIPENSE